MDEEQSRKESVLRLLKKNLDGLTLSVISRSLKLPLDAVRMAVAQLEGANEVTVQVVGASKLIKLKEKK